jgi:RNA polymerase sigma factor (sigma-70 family)
MSESMAMSSEDAKALSQKGGGLPSTHWSVVLSAAESSSPISEMAKQKLCQTYWYPVYAFIRRQGSSHHDAEDLTQEFFRQFIGDQAVQAAHPSKGKFRSFLLACLQNLIHKEWRRENAEKRGGGCILVPLEGLQPEERYRLEPADESTPAKVFDRCWAMSVLDAAMNGLREEYESSGRARLFAELKGTVSGGVSAAYEEIAARLGMREGAVKVAAHRLRHRYGEMLRTEVANTVGGEDDVEQELEDLMAILSGK